jgi:hypothetical protein
LSIDEQHVALPKLYGAPAYARPVAPIATAPRPFDPDDLPIAALMSDGEREYATTLAGRAWARNGGVAEAGDRPVHTRGHVQPAGLRPRPLRLKSIAGPLLATD